MAEKCCNSWFTEVFPAKEAAPFEPPGLLLNANESSFAARYRLLKPLGQGSFGTTFLVMDEQQHLPCVIKQLRSNLVRPQNALELFRQEAQRLAELGEHPQIPKLLHTFEQDGQLFIVQEWIDGWTLEDELLEGAFSEAEIRQLLQALLPVLKYLHDRHIIHRDIKPANIIRRKHDRQLVLVDFGAAKQINTVSTITPGTLIGSAEYAAPEQMRGQAMVASDLYSLGATCLHLLTQMPPFDLYDVGEDTWKWQEYLTEPISPQLKAMLCKLLQPAVRRRYQSAAAALADLNAASMSATKHPLSTGNDRSDAFAPKPLSPETVFPSTLMPLANAVQAIPSIAAATVYDPQTQAWYALPQTNNALEQNKAAFFLSRPVAITPPIQAPLFADDIATLKSLPLTWRVLIVSFGTTVVCVATVCLILCLGILFCTLSTPLPSGVAAKGSNPVLTPKF